jgi:hypothetical protein
MEMRTLKVYLPCLADHVYQLVKLQHGWPSDDARLRHFGTRLHVTWGPSTPQQHLYSSLQQGHGLLVRPGARCSFALQSTQASGLEEDYVVGSFVGCQLDWSSQRFGRPLSESGRSDWAGGVQRQSSKRSRGGRGRGGRHENEVQ